MNHLRSLILGRAIALLMAPPLCAQTNPIPSDSLRQPATYPALSMEQRVHADSINDIRRLFRGRREGAYISAGMGLAISYGSIGILYFGNFAISTIAAVGGKTLDSPSPWLAVKVSIPGLVLTGIGIAKRIRFRKKRERALISAYQQGVPLPDNIQRRVWPAYFQLEKPSKSLRSW